VNVTDLEAPVGLIRSLAAFGGLGLLLALEAWRPFRAPVQSKVGHVAVNLGVAGTNAVAVNLVFGGLLLLWAGLASDAGWGLFAALGLGGAPRVAVSIVALDLIFYGVHWANHRVPVLWRFHRAHHSDLDFDVTTALRFHLGEVLVSTGVKAACIVALGVPPLGLAMFEMMLLAAAQFQHSNLRLPGPWDARLRALIVTPDMHRVHHSKDIRETNSNYGFNLSIWDRLFGTYRAQPRLGHSGMQIGVIGLENARQSVNLMGLLQIPFLPLLIGREARFDHDEDIIRT